MATDILKKAIEDAAKKYGAGSAMYFDDFANVDVKRISTGLPSLDWVLGGGIPEGRILEIFGPASSGKTTLAIKFLIECQKAFPKKPVMFIDVEHALDPSYAAKLGLELHKSRLIFSQPSSAEEALNLMVEFASTGEVSGIVLDSIAQLIPLKETEQDVGGSEMGNRAKLMSQGIRKLAPMAKKNGCTCFFINQTRSTIGQLYGNPETTPGGVAMSFGAGQRIRTSTKKIDEFTAETTMKAIKNKFGIPFRSTKIIIKYGEGFNYLNDLVTTALIMGIIKKNGPMSVYGDKKWKGEALMREEIAKDPKLQKEIEEVIRNHATETEIIEPEETTEVPDDHNFAQESND